MTIDPTTTTLSNTGRTELKFENMTTIPNNVSPAENAVGTSQSALGNGDLRERARTIDPCYRSGGGPDSNAIMRASASPATRYNDVVPCRKWPASVTSPPVRRCQCRCARQAFGAHGAGCGCPAKPFCAGMDSGWCRLSLQHRESWR